MPPLPPDLATAAALSPLGADPRPGTRPLVDTALGALGIQLVHCTAERVVARMPLRDGAGSGVLLVLAETAASTAAGLAAGSDRRAFGAELDASFVAPAGSGTAIAEATPLVLDPDRHTWRIVVHDGDGRLLLESRCTLGIVPAPAPRA